MATVGSESPPRKKLKQARLPFQVISSPRTEAEKPCGGGMKRKLSESAEDDIQLIKVVRSADVEATKENTAGDDLKNGMKAALSSLFTSKIIHTCTESTSNEESSSKTETADSEEKIDNAQQDNEKCLLSKNALDKLASWRKPPCNAPTNVQNAVVNEDTVEEKSGEETTLCKSSSQVETSGEVSTNCVVKDLCQSTIKQKDEAETEGIIQEALSPSLPPTSPEAISEDHGFDACVDLENDDSSTSSKTPVPDLNKLGDSDQNSNKSGNSSLMEIDLESESDKKVVDLNQSCSSTASPKTPKGIGALGKAKVTPKQLARMKESARKAEEREKAKQDKERKRQEEHEEKLRLKLEKEEQKRKDKEEKEEQKRKEKEEKEKRRLADIEQKNEEKRKKEELKAEEKRRKEDEKRKAEEEEERKKAKVSAMFTSFFVTKGAKPAEKESASAPSQTSQNFMPFEVKSDMRMAPCTRNNLDSARLEILEKILQETREHPISDLYLEQLRRGEIKGSRSGRTWLREESKEEDVSVIEPDTDGVFVEQPKLEKMRAKLLQFHENYRPAYYGTWRKSSESITGRRPFAQDKVLEYDVDSADEWEEEEPGESLHGSDDEKDKESEDEYEVDNSVFVPHGYLSDDEGDAEADEEALCPELQKAKLKILGEEFETQMKTETRVLKPIVILLTAAMQSSKLPGSARYQKLADRRAVWREDEGSISLSRRYETNDLFGCSPLVNRTDTDSAGQPGSRGPKPKELAEEAIPALITLINGRQIKGTSLVTEFYEFLRRQNVADEQDMSCAPASSEGANPVQWPKLPVSAKASIARKIKELATWDACTEEGPMKGKKCWIVPAAVRAQYGLADIKMPAPWTFILKRPRAEKVASTESSPSSAGAAPSSADVVTGSAKRSLITNFTKVMTSEEKQAAWEKMKAASPAKKTPAPKPNLGKITAFTSQLPASNPSSPKQDSAKVTSVQPPVKKRVALLVSVPRGQDISSAVEAARSLNPTLVSSPSNFSALKPDAQNTAVKEDSKTTGTDSGGPEVVDLE